MSVDFNRMAAHLPVGQRRQLARKYSHDAKNETTAFLSCFFLGIFGAHDFYLGEWARGFAHLIIPVAAAITLAVGGLLGDLLSLPVTIIVIVLLLAGLIWEIIDLFAIDKKVRARNLTLAEGLIGAGALADNTTLTEAVSRLDSAVTGAGVAGVASGAITAEDVSAAREMAGDQHNAIMEEYDSSTTKFISDDPNATSPGAPHAPHVPQSWTESGPYEPTTLSADEPSAGDTLDMPVPEYVTHTHTETDNSVTDSYEFDRAPDATQPMPKPTTSESEAATWPDHPPLAEATGAAALGAGLGAAGDDPDATDHHAYVPQWRPIADVEGMGATPQYVTLPDEPVAAEPVPVNLPADSYVPPIVPVTDMAGAAGAAGRALASQGDAAPAVPEAAPTAVPESTPESAPASGPLMKRIRMKRQIVVDGQVVREEIVEKLVPVDTETSSMVAEMDTELGHASKEEIAHMANLDPDASLDLRQRTDMAHQDDEPPTQ